MATTTRRRPVPVLDGPECCPSGLTEPMDRSSAEALAHLLKAVADPARLQLIALIRASEAGESCACDTSATGVGGDLDEDELERRLGDREVRVAGAALVRRHPEHRRVERDRRLEVGHVERQLDPGHAHHSICIDHRLH